MIETLKERVNAASLPTVDDLEQFAFSASHDLREPLRTVAVYTELLKRHFGDKLDAKAATFVGYTVSGARRMEALMKDLLSDVQAARGADACTTADPAWR